MSAASYLGPLFCVCMPTLEEKAAGKLPSPDMKYCLYSRVLGPVPFTLVVVEEFNR